MSVETVSLSDGHVELRATTASGKPYTLRGDVEQVRIEAVRDEDYLYSSKYMTPTIEEYTLKFRIKENGEAYRAEMDMVEVRRMASTTAEDRTAAAIDAARVRVGAPEDAKFNFCMLATPYTKEGVAGEPTPVGVEFYWTERVPK